jgi:hypothetical protein
MTQLGDRRATVRLEVVGDLRASLELAEIARVINRSATGMLIASRQPTTLDAVQRIHIREGDRDLQLTARVRHLRRGSRPTLLRTPGKYRTFAIMRKIFVFHLGPSSCDFGTQVIFFQLLTQ